MSGPARLEELAARLRARDVPATLMALAREVAPGQTEPSDRIVAIAWATADLDRAVATAPFPFRRAARDRLLHASTAAVRYGPVQLLLLAPLEPERGRIHAYLSRYGEGVAAFYLERARFLPPSRASQRPPRPVHTPFGRRGWLVPHEWPWGPFVVALEDER